MEYAARDRERKKSKEKTIAKSCFTSLRLFEIEWKEREREKEIKRGKVE